MANWQSIFGYRIPTMLALLCFTGLPGTCSGYPSRALLQPLIPWMQHVATDLSGRASDIFFVSESLEWLVARGAIKFAREDSEYLMSINAGGATICGDICWGFSAVHKLFDK